MAKRIQFVYDDRAVVPEHIARIVGNRSYGSIVRNRRSLASWVIEAARNAGIKDITVLDDAADYDTLRAALKNGAPKDCYVHFRANGAIVDAAGADLLLKKISLADGTLFAAHSNPIVSGFHDSSAYLDYLAMVEAKSDVTANDFDPAAQILLPDDVLVDLSDIANFLAFFSSGFEARFYNRVEGGELTVVKRSTDKAKIEREYRFYGLLPEAMRHWFVQPYDFTQEADAASYRMERLGIADMALIWIHGAISPADFERFVEKIMWFVEQRPVRSTSRDDYLATSRRMYVDKVRQRMTDLKTDPLYRVLDTYLGLIPDFDGIDSVVAAYETMFERYMQGRGRAATVEAVGHGDLCFSNILYDKATRIMKFVDPRGALDEADLWTDPHYDIAKLSHSIFGGYDFINNNLFTIQVDETVAPKLVLSGANCTSHQAIFQDALEAAGYDLYGVRLREASLFLSMLPLHKDDPRKVLGFLLRALDIIKELKRND